MYEPDSDRLQTFSPDAGNDVEQAAPAPVSKPGKLTAVESALAGLWAAQLRVRPRSAAEHFIDLGGDAHKLRELRAQVKAVFGVDLEFLGEPHATPQKQRLTLAAMAAAIEAARAGPVRIAAQPGSAQSGLQAPVAADSSAGPIVYRSRRSRVGAPLSHTQRRAWFLTQLDPDSDAYHEARAYEVHGPIDVVALRTSLERLIERHEILRTTYPLVGEEPRQLVTEHPALEFELIDLSTADRDQVDALSEAALQANRQRRFDLVLGPIVRFALIQRAESEWIFQRCWHHIASDGWSSAVFGRELSAMYEAARAGQANPLAPLPVQYADYAQWQQDRLTGDRLDKQLEFWKGALGGLGQIELPTDFARPALQSNRGRQFRVALPTALSAELKRLSQAEGVTPFMSGLAAFAVLLARYGAGKDIAIGTPIAGRTHSELEGLIGFFANTLVLRTDLSGAPSFRTLLARVRETALGAYTHQELPFEKLVEALAPTRDLSRNPLFQVCFAYQSRQLDRLEFTGARVTRKVLPVQHAKFDLTLDLREEQDTLVGVWEYCTDLFEAGTIERMAGHFGVLLESILADPDRSIDTLALLRPAEREQILVGWNDTARDFGPERCVTAGIEAQAARAPSHPAVLLGEEVLSYGALNERANRLAQHLLTLGVGPDVAVGLYMERSFELVVSVLGVLKAGGVYVPLDPDYPRARLAFMLEDCAAPIVLTQSRLVGGLPSNTARVLCVDSEWDSIAASPAQDPPGPALSDVAYLIYTSGSTGTPKGVQVLHRGLANHMAWLSAEIGLTPDSRVLQKTSISFDVSVWELIAPLWAGARIVLAEPGGHRDAQYLLRVLRDAGVTHLMLVPAAARALLEGDGLAACQGLRHIQFGGEALDWPLVRAFRERLPDTRLGNFYGPTEATDTTTSFEITTIPALESLDGSSTVPIGRPIANVRCHVLDAHLQPVPPGVIGELYIGGAGLARGYLNNPALTAQRFIDDPFRPGERLYRSGDRVRYLPDGTLAFAGRDDQQVKIRGFRIELGEIEAALNACAGVSQCVVIAREDQPGLKRLVAYVVGSSTQAVLIEQLHRRLPEYMVPGAFVFLEYLPVLPNGKLDRGALPAPQYEALGAGEGYVAPTGQTEQLIAAVWAELLGVPQVSATDDFFALGGHSLLAGQMAVRLFKLCQVELPLRRIFERPTVRALAAEIELLRRDADRPGPDNIPLADRSSPLALSFAQESLWFLDQLEPGASTYNLPVTLRMSGALDERALRASFDALIERHEALRTRFTTIDGEARQIVDRAQSMDWTEHDLRDHDVSDAEARARELLKTESNRPFDLAQGPLARVMLLRLTAQDYLLTINLHHIITDGWSTDVMMRELRTLYGAFRDGGVSPLPALPVQYADYAAWQRERLRGDRFERLLTYWRDKLAGLEPFALPADRPRPAIQTHRGARESRAVSRSLLEPLKALAARHNATLFMVLLSAFKLLLSRLSGQEDIAIGSPVAGRDRAELDGLIGLFLNTLVLRTDLSGDPTFDALLARVRQTALDAYANQDMPFDRLVAAVNPVREANHNPLFDVMINHIDGANAKPDLPGLHVRAERPQSTSAKFALTLYIGAHADGIDVRLVYQTDLFSSERARCMLDQFMHLLEQIAVSPQRRIHEYSLVTTDMRARLPDPRAIIDTPAQQSVVEQVLDWAARSPDQVAVREAGGVWTYADLITRSSSLAMLLHARGLERGAVVAIIGPRGAAMVGAMLAVLMGGGAFLTIDPALPTHRKRAMLRQARVGTICSIAQSMHDASVLALDAATTVLQMDLDLLPTPGLAVDAGEQDRSPAQLPNPGPDDPAYVFFTSGSTGEPKGILGCHKGLSHFLKWQRETFAIKPNDRVSQLISLSFDPLLRDVFLPLTAGATICVPSEGDLIDTVDWIARERVTIVHATPTVMQAWLQDHDDRVTQTHLRCVFVSGEPLTDTLVNRWRKQVSDAARLVNFYGPTETTMTRCFYPIPAIAEPGVQPIGTPLPESQALVLNAAGQLCGVGETGEIVLRTPFRSLGYINLPEENARRFRRNPFRDDPTDLVYFSGDRGRYRPDGLLEIAGRLDDQVKIRGVRVEPSEVMASLMQHDAVAHCIVIAAEDRSGQRQLIAYVTRRSDAPIGARALRDHLKLRLPEAFIPSAFVFLDAMPLLPNGKVDRRALPAPQADAQVTDPVAPRSPLEQAVAEIWCELLGLEAAGIHDDFFICGGHSLLAIRLVARLSKLCGANLPLRQVFESPTIAGLASVLDRLSGREDVRASADITAGTRTATERLSFAQERMWFLDRLMPANASYNVVQAVDLTGDLDIDALTDAIDTLIARHESLRTTFTEVDGQPVQVVHPAVPITIAQRDLAAFAQPEQAEMVIELSKEEAEHRFDLTRGPLIRVTLARLAERRFRLLLNLHHIIADGWSLGVFAREVSVGYNAKVASTTARLPALPIQYADYARWQRRWLSGEVLEQQLAYWRAQLAEVTNLELPTDRPRPALPSYRGAEVEVELPVAHAAGLKVISHAAGATLFMAGLAAFKVLLYRYCGSTDIPVGTPIAGRGRTELEGLIGFFANTLVLRTDLAGTPTFRQVLMRVRETALGAYTHQDLPFEKLVEELAPVRDLSRNPIFQVCFALIGQQAQALVLEGIGVDRVSVPTQSAKFDLTLRLTEREGQFQAGFEYCTDLFERATIERMAEHFGVLLGSILADPDAPIDTLPLIGTAERERLLVQWNDTAAPYPRDSALIDLFETQVRRTPDAPALIQADRSLSYQALDARANRLAHVLGARGVGRGTLVGICLERSMDMVVAQLAILKSGAAYVPLDPAYPVARLISMAQDAALAVLVTHSALTDVLPWPRQGTLLLDADAAIIDAAPASVPTSVPARPEDPAYVIYTSGSTGRPKGVVVPRGAVVNFLTSMTRTPGLNAADCLVAVTTLSFDIAVLELLLPLTVGARVVLADRNEVRDGVALRALLESSGANAMQATPTTWRMLIEAGWQGAPTFKALIGGEALPRDLAVQLLARSGELWNMYGPTETTVWSTCWKVERPEEGISIGRPIANTRILILDERRQLCPVGVPGELYIGGDGITHGYWNRADLTTERFVDDPFHPGQRLYRTGDVVRYLPDGNIAFAGRNDQQVKIRGYRIELGEIEAALSDCAGVGQCVVVAREDQPGLKRLVAYVVGESLDPGVITEQVKRLLPSYMVPTAIVCLARLPLLPNGKIDRRALPAPDYEALGAREGYVAPSGETERLVAAVWAELLGLAEVGANDDFFALGGHSLLAGRLGARLAKLCQVELPLRRIFETPTVRGLAREIECLRGTGQAVPAPTIPAADRTGPLPLSFAQQRLWFLEQLRPDSATYNMPTAMRLRGTLQRQSLHEALDALIARHESLRTRFVTTDGEACQIVDAAHSIDIVEHDLRAMAEESARTRAQELVQSEADRPFDLTRGPLLRVLLLQLGEAEHVLLLNVHHIISDGWSADIFERELATLYNARVAGVPVTLAPLPVQYVDYALWQREWLAGAVLGEQLAYWKTQLDGLATLDLPTDKPRPAVQSYRGARVDTPLADTVGERLRALSRREGTTLFIAGLAAFKVLLYRYCGSADVPVGTPIAGRGRTELESLIGFFANTLVLRTDLSGGPGFREVLARVRESALGAYGHQDVPFEKLVEELAPERDPSRNPLFQVCFAFAQGQPSALQLTGLERHRFSLATEQSKFDLTLTLRSRDGRLNAGFEYCTDLFERTTIERMAGHFAVLLEAILETPDQPIDTLPLMDVTERRALLKHSSEMAASYPKGQTLGELFSAQGERTPAAVAIVHEGVTLTYRALDERANQLANYLRARGAGTDAPVAICMERGPKFVVALLGIVKAGAAYLPLDADQPPERLAFMLQDAAALWLLTEEALLGRVPAGACQRVCIDRDWDVIATQSPARPVFEATPQRLAYVMYTSGSTGKPKGVAIRQESVIRLVARPNYVDITPADTIAQIANVAFDAATFEIWGALLHGARLAILSRDVVLEPQRFVAAVAAHEVSCMFLTTALFNRIAAEQPDAFRALRHVLFGGEACDPDRVQAVMQAGPPARLVHVYGPTETTTFATFHVVRDREAGTVPIGRPISATQVLLLDPRGQLVPPGVVGELYIGGPGVAVGYLNRPEETRARFVPHPLDPDGEQPVYRTGDLGRWRADGAIEFVGRNDDQVKIRGFRIEPAEVGAVLGTHPDVRGCHVMARAQASGDIGLTAYVVADGGAEARLSTAALRRFLGTRLPGYMVPTSFVAMAALPLTANGKVDARALPDPNAAELLDRIEYTPPRDDVERTMCRVWAEVLGIERVGLDDNFFEIGGHSLLAAKLFAHLDEAFGRTLTLSVLFVAPTVRLLADHYRSMTEPTEDPGRALVPLHSEGTRPPIYFLPGVFGNVVGYADLVRAFGPDQPFYGLQSIGLDGRAAPLDSIEAMASHYIDELRTHQPHGPFALIGACFGATVAYEMSRQLMAAGTTVAFLGLIDPTTRGGEADTEQASRAPRALKRAAALGSLVRGRVQLYRQEMRGLGLIERMSYLQRKMRSLGGSVIEPNAFKGAQRELNQLEVYRTNVRALDRFVRRPLTGSLLALDILETAHTNPNSSRHAIDWATYWNGPTTRHTMPGKDSGDMLAGDNARVVATRLSERLQAVFQQYPAARTPSAAQERVE